MSDLCRLGRHRRLLLEHLLHDLLLLDQESAHNALAHASRAARATVGTRHVFLPLADALVLARAKRRNLQTSGVVQRL